MIKSNLYRSIILVILFAVFQFGHMGWSYFFPCIYVTVTGLLFILCYEYTAKSLFIPIWIMGWLFTVSHSLNIPELNQYYYLPMYLNFTGMLSFLAYKYKGKGLLHGIAVLGWICSLNPLVKEILGVGTKVFMTDYVFGYGSLIVLILLITNSINKDAK